jgi:hypothetical protein
LTPAVLPAGVDIPAFSSAALLMGEGMTVLNRR